MEVKRLSGVSIRRRYSRDLTTEKKVHRMVDWMNAQIKTYDEIINRHVEVQNRRLTEIDLKIESIEEYIEDNG